ncbi:hypothetical protein B0T22DRAFT_446144 [Podospora appendiculata]|uniref:Protein kinase domain-containing protein n=1 Tax=Podospora appendiculata TaxID=314037 RepID=A0AAE1CEX6_9PEZI|nr:hypothetical protein B0T22DRAFT_446144 [Podospora appendiculata]
MSGFEIAGVSLAVAGLLLTINGAVDGFNLLADICEKDNGLRFAFTQYHVEKAKLVVWAERFKVEDEINCLLLQQSQVTRDAVWRIIAEMNATHELAIKFITKYKVDPLAVPATVPAGSDVLQSQSKWAVMLRDARDRVPQGSRVKWAARDREKFMGLISRLTVLNADLWDVVTPEETDAVRIVTGVLSGLTDQLSLAALQASPSTSSPASLLAFAAQLKQMQGETVSELAQRVKIITASELQVWKAESNDTSRRFRGTYTSGEVGGLPEPVWIEWKAVEKNNKAADAIMLRIHALGALLATANAAAFHRPVCLGVYEDAKYKERTSGDRRAGFVYRLDAPTDGSDLPLSLSDLVHAAQKTRTRAPLGDRFELAYKLASALSLFHATGWIHKSLRSDSILFSSSSSSSAPLGTQAGIVTAPQISGFQYSRPDADMSLESRPVGKPELDMYYHPEVASGWTKVKEIYSLGIVLLEIAYWRPVFEERFRQMSMARVSQAILADLEGKFGDDLAGMAGRTFVDVIKCCLAGRFGSLGGGACTPGEESKMLSDAFFHKVVRPLASLRA